MTDYAVDTSVVIAAVDVGHALHQVAAGAVLAHRPAMAGHTAFEAFSVLTRIPPPGRRSPDQAEQLLRNNFPDPCWLKVDATARVFRRLGELRIVGGAVYDALVAQAALDNQRTLLSLDRRAERTYLAVGVSYEMLA